MNDLFIIIVCIILMLIIWGFYFKSIREGNDPNAANYTMPISFTGEKVDKNEKITIPQIIQTNNNENMTFNNDVNMTGHVNMQEKKFVTFGKGDAISANNNWGGRNELEIVGVGSCSNGCNRYIHMWDDVVVDRNLNVNNDLVVNNSLYVNNGDITIQNGHWLQIKGGGINTNWVNTGGINSSGDINSNSGNVNINNGNLNLNNWHGMFANWFRLNNTSYVQGIQMGRVYDQSEGYVSFPNQFVNDNVFVFTSRLNGDSRALVTINIWEVSRYGFRFFQEWGRDHGGYKIEMGWTYDPFSWIAFCS
jgi:hypothetical protein